WTIIWDHPADNVTYCEVNAIDFINDSTGFASGRGLIAGGGGFGFIIKTIDRGLNWSVVFGSSPVYDVTNPIDIQMVGDSSVIAIDDDFDLLRSDDSGETWSIVSFINPDTISCDVTATSMYAFCPDTVFVIAETTAWLTKSGCNSKRKILRTTDGGQSWIVQYFDVVIPCYDTPLLSDITFINDTVGISVGNDLILRTTNLGGDTHIPDTVIYGGIEDRPRDQSGIMIFPNPTTGYLTIELNTGDYEILDIFSLSGTIIRTLALNKINVIDLTPYSSGLYILKFSGKQTCYHRIIKTW
ncbi:MAG: T9SS type A sorting domain-containing protein, partial [Bacteroidales bacterium]|nr:T9SS type A sorting domain-containing protein [Bacteroidales bacterium]